jgi:secernin
MMAVTVRQRQGRTTRLVATPPSRPTPDATTLVPQAPEEAAMCDTIVVVGDDRVLFAKNSDRDPNEAQPLEWHPAARHPTGSNVRCTHIEIPQVEHTHAVLLSRPFWMWGAEMGANEHGLVIGNEAVFTRRPTATVGLTGMDLLRLALERARDAAGAVETIVALLEEHGQGGGCGLEDPSFTYHNSFLIADPHTAVVLETADRHWATETVTHGVRAISNGLTIPAFAAEHADRLRTRVCAASPRRALTESRAGEGPSPATMAAALRQHGRPTTVEPQYSLVNGAMSAPCMHAGGLVAASQTTASWISELTPAGARHWATATAAPCTGLFKPIAVDEPVDLGPTPTARFDPASTWWAHERLHRLVARDPARLLPTYAAQRDELESAWFTDPPSSASAFATAAERTRIWWSALSEQPVEDTRPWYVRRYWRLRDEQAGMPVHEAALTP